MKKLHQLVSLTLCAVTLIGIMATCAHAANTASFSDVPAAHWANSYVQDCVSKGIVTGVGNGKFDPDGKVTYAQFAVMVSKAFYPEKAAAASGSPWYAPYTTILREAGLFDKTELVSSDALAERPMTRFEMAQISSNLLQTVGKGSSFSDELQIRQQITDWDSVAEARQFAVISCYKHRILGGYADGRFGGGDTMTRAQACVVLNSLDIALGTQSGTVQQPAQPAAPDQTSVTTKDIEVTTLTTQWGTGYYVKDNGFGDGYLNNGKPITEENVLELLDEAQKIWPTGMSWTERNTRNNHWYEWSGSVVDSIMLNSYGVSTNYACGGFASMLSDYLFGLNDNATHQVTDPMAIRAGDIILKKINGRVDHVMMAATSTIQSGDFAGRTWIVDGNNNAQVHWPNYQYGTPNSEFLNNIFVPGTTWEVYSRYPE